MRVLLCLHHHVDPNAGAARVTLGVGEALRDRGCAVEYLGYDRAFPGAEEARASHQLRFPWRLARFLAGQAGRFDVIDVSAGDGWVWAALGRPGALSRHALIARSHGLEHVADDGLRREARSGGPPLSRKYPLYHGGFRLWEVRRSLLSADRCVLGNRLDESYARDRLGVPRGRLRVIPNGVAERFFDIELAPRRSGAAIRLAFTGSWISRKGTRTLVEVVELLAARGVPFSISLLGVGEGVRALDDFPAEVRDRVAMVPTFANAELPELLAGHDVFVFPSLSEGASLALLEAMACGLVPIATPAGDAPEVIERGRSGMLVETGDARAIADHVMNLAADPPALEELRRGARARAREYRWERRASETLALYEEALAERAGTRGLEPVAQCGGPRGGGRS